MLDTLRYRIEPIQLRIAASQSIQNTTTSTVHDRANTIKKSIMLVGNTEQNRVNAILNSDEPLLKYRIAASMDNIVV
jgi:hypothetical protein